MKDRRSTMGCVDYAVVSSASGSSASPNNMGAALLLIAFLLMMLFFAMYQVHYWTMGGMCTNKTGFVDMVFCL